MGIVAHYIVESIVGDVCILQSRATLLALTEMAGGHDNEQQANVLVATIKQYNLQDKLNVSPTQYKIIQVSNHPAFFPSPSLTIPT